MTGYVHPQYAQSLAEVGLPRELPGCGAWILQRPIPSFPYYDAMGCYPLFVCRDWSQLPKDLTDLRNKLITLSVVTDPFGEYNATYLRRCFPDLVVPFKAHFTIDLRREMNTYVADHHRRNVRRGFKKLRVELCEKPEEFAEEWIRLYSALISRHNIAGIAAFSPSALRKQLKVPGIVMFRALYGEATVGIILWYVHEGRGYYHLGAYSDTGYELRASFVLFWSAIRHFAESGLRWLSLGAGPGVGDSGADGLTRFKRGWSTETRTAYFCGRVFDREKYIRIVEANSIPATTYFPAYRRGEFS